MNRAPQDNFGSVERHDQPKNFGPKTDASNDTIDLLNVARILWHRRMMILLFMLVSAVLAGFYAFRIATPEYRATTQMALQIGNQQVVNFDSIMSGASTDEAAINTELAIIKSRPLIEQMIMDLDLVSDPEFNPFLGEQGLMTKAKWLVRSLYGVSNQEVSVQSEDEVIFAVTEALDSSIVASSNRNTYILRITVTTGDAEKSANIANKLAELYLEDQVQNKFAATEYAVDFLSKRVQELEMELKAKEDSIEAVRAETELISQEALEVLRVRAKDLRSRSLNVTSSITQQQAALASLEEVSDRRALATGLGDATLRNLLPAVQAGETDAEAMFDTRVATLIKQRQNEIDQNLEQKASLDAALQDLENEIERQNSDLLELTQLGREADATRVLYETFLARLKETSVQIGLQQADSRILASATRGQLIAPRKSIIIIIGLMLGCIVGIVIVLLQPMLHQGFRLARDLEQATGTMVFAQIPKISGRSRTDIVRYLIANPTSAAAEAIRNLRTSILMSNLDKSPQLIISTSSRPGEGKTTHAVALANNFADLGKRVLLVEGDLRRQTLGDYFETEHTDGLVAALIDEKPLEEVITRDPNFGFDLLMGGRLRANAADIFASERFGQFITVLRDAYDFIIIDTPPVLVVPDARIIAAHADAVIYTVQWDATMKSQILEGQKEFASIGVSITGFVLSQIDPKGMQRYGYGGQYGAYSQYGQGYYNN
ncbi:polysaccharide biosynthesis tyrosine autokinase [Sagittula sp. NFXS13]|uniref:GumC family protein n=1 Tax=Sagittula sp. NFXS13 TaxID=2819095 RepID=UPI0032DEF5F4